jgi:purine-cytosine permease-like protein
LFSRLPTPSTKLGRTILGVLLVIGGILGFLPVLGFWMIPLGLLILSEDFAVIRRFRRRWTVKLTRWWEKFKAGRKAKKNGHKTE